MVHVGKFLALKNLARRFVHDMSEFVPRVFYRGKEPLRFIRQESLRVWLKRTEQSIDPFSKRLVVGMRERNSRAV
jgi:hypothetical protein